MAQILEFPEIPNKFGITPTIAQELIANGYNPNSWRDIQKWLKDIDEVPPDGYA
tara:strand:- start:357 stop:518 length:162 start_codon:yes stop_codon:yes gene_type:complete